jgi:multicomponent K+:H+ antiporter subunit E
MKPSSPPAAKVSAAPARWFAHPALSLMLAAVWLLLQESLALPHLLVAAVLAWGVPRLVHGFLGPASRPRRWGLVLRFTGVVLWDIVVSNIAVARIVLNPAAKPQPAWVHVPLDTRHPLAVTLLATIITTTPGTVSCVVDDEAGFILVHALDCSDPDDVAQQIKSRYEQPLRSIFEGVDA